MYRGREGYAYRFGRPLRFPLPLALGAALRFAGGEGAGRKANAKSQEEEGEIEQTRQEPVNEALSSGERPEDQAQSGRHQTDEAPAKATQDGHQVRDSEQEEGEHGHPQHGHGEHRGMHQAHTERHPPRTQP